MKAQGQGVDKEMLLGEMSVLWFDQIFTAEIFLFTTEWKRAGSYYSIDICLRLNTSFFISKGYGIIQ